MRLARHALGYLPSLVEVLLQLQRTSYRAPCQLRCNTYQLNFRRLVIHGISHEILGYPGVYKAYCTTVVGVRSEQENVGGLRYEEVVETSLKSWLTTGVSDTRTSAEALGREK